VNGSVIKNKIGESYLSSSLTELPTSYLKKRAAYWLARCSKTKGDMTAFASYKTLYSSIAHAFPVEEEAELW
jgi:hypothetical protein